jgi:hypothetical protein
MAEKNIKTKHWKILSLDEIWRVPRGFYKPEDINFLYYEQALFDKEVYVFHQSPKYPVYYVEYEVIPMKKNKRFSQKTHAIAKYWVMNEKVASKSDFYDDFWGKLKHQRKAISLGRQMIQSEEWRVTAVRGGNAVNFRSHADNATLTQYYDEAEEYGECLAFWIEET